MDDDFNHPERAAIMALHDARPIPAFARDTLQGLTRRGFVLIPASEEGDGAGPAPVLTASGRAAAEKIGRILAGMGDIIAKPHKQGPGAWG